jgi:hypothetical protein
MKLSDLWRWNGEISRSLFIVWGAVLFALKYNLDRLILKFAFHREWSVFKYFDRPVPWLNFSPSENPGEYAVLLAMALPFLLAGIVLSNKRLRSAGLPLWLAVLFVLPVLKWFLFLALAFVPKRRERAAREGPVTLSRHNLARWFPKSAAGSAGLAAGLSVALGMGAAALGAQVLQEYGWGLFAGLPFCMGFFGALIHGARERRSLRQNLAVALLSVVLTGAALLVVALEGFICILMAAPLAFALAAIGAVAGHTVQSARWNRAATQIYCLPVFAIPLMLSAEHWLAETPPLLKVTTALEVNAPPERVWQNVVSFTQLPPPTEMLFHCGIAYPVRAEIKGRGPGAVRYCVFSTGPFIEPIETWDEPRLLRFSVTSNPAPMREWSPYRDMHPAHLDGFLVSKQGQFLLTPLPGGHTRLEGTTWYCHNMWPAAYWQVWSDQIIHKIHLRVLNHVKRLSEESRRRKGPL